MKVFLHYEDCEDSSLHKTLKITLPKSWKNGPTSKLLNQFVETYNAGEQGTRPPLDASELKLTIRTPADELSSSLKGNSSAPLSVFKDDDDNNNNNNDSNDIITDIASDAITIETIDDRQAVYITHGKSQTLAEIAQKKRAEQEAKRAELANTVACVHFGCKKRFPKGGPYGDCCYHIAPPVFHETAKFWSCCPDKKAYDWEDFQAIPGCRKGKCTDVRDDEGQGKKQFLGGCDLRDAANGPAKLKSIDDFNTAQAAGGSDAAPVLERLRSVMEEIGVECELFDQVIGGIKKDLGGDTADDGDDILAETAQELGAKLKKAMKSIAVDQLRIK